MSLATISLISNQLDASLAGLLIGIHIVIILISFIIDNDKSINYTVTYTISIIILAIGSLLFYYLYIVKKVPKHKTIFYSLVLWVICIIMVWKSNLAKQLRIK